METEDRIQRLVQLGLTGYEARTYLALIGRGTVTAGEAARLGGVPRQRIYDVLETLVGKGMASVRPGAVAHYVATEPTAAVGRLVEARRREIEDLELAATAMVEDLAPAYRAGRENVDPLDYIEVLRDPGAIATRFDELQASVDREILIFNRPPYARPPQENLAGLPLARKHVARGLYEFSLFDDLAATEGVRRFIQEGEEARFVPELPLKLVILDETTVMFGMQDPVADRADLTIVVIEHADLACVLKAAFESYWTRGLTFEEAYEANVAGVGADRTRVEAP